MTISSSERRQIENEMFFRRSNEKVSDDLRELAAMHIETGHTDLVHDEDMTLQFKCECSDENCTIRIPMSLSEYKEIHASRDAFTVIPGHQVGEIERVVKRAPEYNVVKKKNLVKVPPKTLNYTPIKNT